MIKKLITATTLLFIENAPKSIYCIRSIFNFIIFAQYPLHNNEAHFYLDHTLYKLDKIKIAFVNHYSINVKQF